MSKNQRDFFKKKNEWSEIKDKLLDCYLPQYFQKLLTTRKPILYVDCFAGKGKFDDGQYGSPLIALDAIKKSMSLSRSGQSWDAIEMCFIELHHSADLIRNLKEFPGVYCDMDVIGDKFENNIQIKLQDKQGYNVFLYIDPYGIEALDSELFDEFRTYGFHTFEMLINFNSFGFFRDACRAMKVEVPEDDEAFKGLEELVEYQPTEVSDTNQSRDLLTRIAGGDYWKDIVSDYKDKKIDGYQAEKRLSKEYKSRLKQKYKYVLDMPIRIKHENRPKYRMIHVCNHEDGCFLMAENMQRRKSELFTYIQLKGQISMFEESPVFSSTVEGEILTEEDIAKMVRTQVRLTEKEVHLRTFEADFCNEYGVVCPFSMIHSILESMERKGEVEIIRDPARTSSGRISHFWDEKNGQTVLIRRLMA